MTAARAVRLRVNPAHDHAHRQIIGTGHVRLLRCADCGQLRGSIRHIRLVPRLDVIPARDNDGVTRAAWCALEPLAAWAGQP